MLTCFDVDGVLVEVGQSYYRAMAETVSYFLQKPIDPDLLLRLKFSLNLNNDWDATLAGLFFYRCRLDLDTFVRQMSPGPPDFRKLYTRAEATGLILPSYNELVKKFNHYYRQFRNLEKLNLSPAALEEIRSLASVTAVITGRTKEELDFTFEKFSLYKYFDYLITEDDMPSHESRKPSSYPLRLLFEKCGFCGPACYAGDTLADSQMVENFNRENNGKMAFVLYQNSHNTWIKADFYVENEQDLLQVLKKIAAGNK